MCGNNASNQYGVRSDLTQIHRAGEVHLFREKMLSEKKKLRSTE